MKAKLFKKSLDIHVTSSSGRIARSFQISFILSSIILSIGLFFILFFIINMFSSNTMSDFQINEYIENKMSQSVEVNSLNIDFINPIQSDLFVISKGLNSGHKGVDIVAEKGSIVSASSIGSILYVGFDKKYGNSVLISHKNNFYTFYGHLDTILVKSHRLIKKGESIGTVGETGYSTGPHLHFEIWHELEIKDPRILIKELKGRDVAE